MNTIEIKALKAGSGKTVTLVNLFKKTHLKNKLILTPSNKARQVCIQRLCKDYSMEYDKAAEMVKTLRSFKRNYVQVKLSSEDNNETYVTIESKNHITYEPYNLFIDEASMISDFEMQDLVKHWRIQNLILDGDCLQFEPIGGKQAILAPNGEVKVTNEGEVLLSEDSGALYNLPIDHQVLLTKQFRAHDSVLLEAIDLIKKGEIMEAIFQIVGAHNPIDCMNLPTDQHIAYTNEKCKHLNEMYKGNVDKWIVVKDDKMHSFFTSEIIKNNDSRFKQLENDLMYEAIQNPEKKIPTFEEWKNTHLKPAYAITCHKLQGSTIESGDIFIHIDDILLGLQDVLDENERAKLFQKFLYIAVSRATSVKQLNLYGLGISFIDLLKIDSTRRSSSEEFKNLCTECMDELLKMDELAEEMIDPTIKEDAVRYSADDEDLIDYLESVIDYEVVEDEMYLKWKEEHYQSEEYSKAHSVKHKQHKYKYTDEYLLTFESLPDLRKVTKNAKVIKRFRELKNI